METLTIGRLARRAEVNPETIRYYEREGILDAPRRLSSGYRIFSEDSAQRIRFIKRAQKLGFSLREIRELLSLRHERTGDEIARVKRAATEKISEIDAKMKALAAMRSALKQLETACPGSGPLSDCPILECLESDETEAGQPKRKQSRSGRAGACKVPAEPGKRKKK